MAVQVSYPGVYIEEFAPGAPIQGVSTNIAGLVGVAARGPLADPLEEPMRVSSWEQFQQTYGEEPVPGFYLWYAARGFFENGGKACYVARASNGACDEAQLSNRGGNDFVRVRARLPGVSGITVDVAELHRLAAATTSLYQPTAIVASVTGRDLTLNADRAWQFRPGDYVTVGAGGERRRVDRVAADVLRIAEPFNNAQANDAVRLADAPAGHRVLRLASPVSIPPDVLAPGTLLTISQGVNTASVIVEGAQAEFLYDAANALTTTWRVTLRAPGLPAALGMAASATVQSEEFRLTVHAGGATVYDNLAIDSAHPRYYVTMVNGDTGGLVQVTRLEPPPSDAPPDNLPANVAGVALAGGADENLANLALPAGDSAFLAALETLRRVDEISLVAIPDRRSPPVQQALVTHCEQLADRFAVLDPDYDFFDPLHGGVENQRQGVASQRGYAALYYPWVRVPPRGSGEPVLVPPSGHVCGIMARSDEKIGVHKAPANEFVAGAVGVERRLGRTDHGLLNLQGINVIEQSGFGRPLLMGARTTATDRNWQYVNIRRLFLYLEESIEEGIHWAIFEPNNLQLWQKLKRSITDFLTRAWRDGGLFGKTAEEAFYVRIDEALNPFSEQQLGRLNIEIGVRPTYPAEFIVVRIGIWPGGAEVTEG